MPVIGQLNFPAVLSPRKKHWHTLIRRMDGPWNRSGHPRFEYPTVYYVAQSQFSLCSPGSHLPQVIQVFDINFHWSTRTKYRFFPSTYFIYKGKICIFWSDVPGNFSFQSAPFNFHKLTYITGTVGWLRLKEMGYEINVLVDTILLLTFCQVRG